MFKNTENILSDYIQYSELQIGQVFADDADANADLTFSLPDDVTHFRINEKNGKVYVKSALDRETTAVFEFTVSVSDASVQPNTADAVIRVKILDLNDNAPRFNKAQNGVIQAEISENKDNSTIVTQVTAMDADEGENQRVSYSIIGGE